MKVNAQFAINSLSFGFCSYNILRKLHTNGVQPNLFTIGEPDYSSFDKMDDDFKFFIEGSRRKAFKHYSRKDPCIKLWHLHGSEQSCSDETVLFSFYELDSPTKEELNIIKNQKIVLFSCRETVEMFREEYGCDNVDYCPLGFDETHFKKVKVPPIKEGAIVFGIYGKFEKRKHHQEAIRAWVKHFGDKSDYLLNIAISNPFLNDQQNQAVLHNIFNGIKPSNVNCLPFVPVLSQFNQVLNAADIVIDASGAEGFSLPSFHSLGLGKHGVIHNCSAMKDWANNENAVLFNPRGKESAMDNMFFHEGGMYNQGNIYSFDEDAFIAACEEAIERYKKNPVNEAGKSLVQKYTWDNTVDKITGAI